MKLSKKKVFALALAVCLIATLSFGSLAWFTDNDSVTNDFMIAGSDDEKPDEIFSVDVWEDKNGDGQPDDDDTSADGEGLVYEDILPGDILTKVAHVKNTGSYEQYIRVKITVSDAKVWQAVYKANMVPVTEFVNVDLDQVYEGKVGSYLDEENNSFVYYLYYNNILPLDDETTPTDDESDMIVFDEAYVSGHLTKEQAWDMTEDGFQISVYADAVQAANVCTDNDPSNDVYEAFETVGMLDETNAVNTTYVETEAELKTALTEGKYVVLAKDVEFDRGLEIASVSNLYLNNFTLSTKNYEDAVRYSMTVSGDLTIGGYGKVLLPDIYGIRLNGTLRVYGGTFVDDENREANRSEALITVKNGGELNIYGGEFNGQDNCVVVEAGGIFDSVAAKLNATFNPEI